VAVSVSEELIRQIHEFCKHVAGPCEIIAASLSDDEALEIGHSRATAQVLVVIKNFQPRLMSYPRIIDEKNIVIVAVDQWVFERDIDRGFLGEALASSLIFPYSTLVNEDYLHLQETVLKKRLILELLENIILSFPELSYRIRIKPKYFMYEVILNRVRVFPPLAYGISNFLCGTTQKEKISRVLKGYLEALQMLEKEKLILFVDGYVAISKQFVMESKSSKVRLANFSKIAPRALFSSVFGLFPQFLNFFSQSTGMLSRFQVFPWKKEFEERPQFINPQKYVFVPTAQGFVSLADKVDIRAYAKKVLSEGTYSAVKVEEFGGVLNDVYLMKAYSGKKEKKILVKRYKDWSSFKWLPLTLWATGARSFAVLGTSRLERECAISELLACEGFNVPKVLHVSHNERLIFMEFIEGENLSNAIKRIAVSQSQNHMEKELATITLVGENYAKVHALNVVLGDTKPENVMVDNESKIFLVDLEQASRNGDKAWDVAEFLYFSGHYLPLDGEIKAKAIAQAFISGYLKAGGNVNDVKRAGISKYTRVFSIFTLPSIIRVMSNICKETEERKRENGQK
jgi:tRNA A-37 threonylcarbamoyl transferase component Bud32